MTETGGSDEREMKRREKKDREEKRIRERDEREERGDGTSLSVAFCRR